MGENKVIRKKSIIQEILGYTDDEKEIITVLVNGMYEKEFRDLNPHNPQNMKKIRDENKEIFKKIEEHTGVKAKRAIYIDYFMGVLNAVALKRLNVKDFLSVDEIGILLLINYMFVNWSINNGSAVYNY